MKAIRYLLVTGVILTLIILSAGCTDYMPALGGGYMITDNNVTHQKWQSEYLEDTEKFKTNPENPLEWTLKECAVLQRVAGMKKRWSIMISQSGLILNLQMLILERQLRYLICKDLTRPKSALKRLLKSTRNLNRLPKEYDPDLSGNNRENDFVHASFIFSCDDSAIIPV